MKRSTILGILVLAFATAAFAGSDKLSKDFVKGSPALESVGALTFGPEGILFIGDASGGAIFSSQFHPKLHIRPGSHSATPG